MIHPIRTEAEYETVLARVDALMHAESGTADGDDLDVLVSLIEAYEARHWPIPADGAEEHGRIAGNQNEEPATL
jgi:HTH-type transcriptional regulator/antitoxin HigA